MSESLGDLIDKLSIANNKIWHLQEMVYVYSKMSAEEYARLTPEETHQVWKKLASSNLTRTNLIGEIDTRFEEAIRTGSAPADAKVKIT